MIGVALYLGLACGLYITSQDALGALINISVRYMQHWNLRLSECGVIEVNQKAPNLNRYRIA